MEREGQQRAHRCESAQSASEAVFDVDCLVRNLRALCSISAEQNWAFDGENCENYANELDMEMDPNRLMLSLKCLLIALREGGPHFAREPRLMSLVADSVCKMLLMLYALSLHILAVLLHSLRAELKHQTAMLIDALFVSVLRHGLSETHRKGDLFLATALEHLADLCRTPWFVKDVWLNFDCDAYAANVCGDIVALLTKLSIPAHGDLRTTHYLALCCFANIAEGLSDTDDVVAQSKKVLFLSKVRAEKARKVALQKAVALFNCDARKGIAALLQQMNICSDIEIVDRIVDVFLFCSAISAPMVGIFLDGADDLNAKVRARYIARRYVFGGLTLDVAMRLFFEDFRLPVETVADGRPHPRCLFGKTDSSERGAFLRRRRTRWCLR